MSHLNPFEKSLSMKIIRMKRIKMMFQNTKKLTVTNSGIPIFSWIQHDGLWMCYGDMEIVTIKFIEVLQSKHGDSCSDQVL